MAIFGKGIHRESMYDYRQWEYCVGTEDLTEQEAKQLIADWRKTDKLDYGCYTTEYEFRQMTVSELAEAGHYPSEDD